MSSAVLADHMNGVYLGQGNAAGATLTLTQTNRDVTGTISANNLRIDFSGTTDGNDNANSQVSVNESGTFYSGFMASTLQQHVLTVDLNVQGNERLSGRYQFTRNASAQPTIQSSDTTQPTHSPSPPQQPSSLNSNQGVAPGGLPNFD